MGFRYENFHANDKLDAQHFSAFFVWLREGWQRHPFAAEAAAEAVKDTADSPTAVSQKHPLCLHSSTAGTPKKSLKLFVQMPKKTVEHNGRFLHGQFLQRILENQK